MTLADHIRTLDARYYARLQKRLRLKYPPATPLHLAMLEMYRRELNPKPEEK